MSITEHIDPGSERWLRLRDAAPRLGLSASALRARLCRNARQEGAHLVSHPGLGVEGRKLGAHWRVRLST